MQTSRRYRLSARRQGADGGLPFPLCYENHGQDSRIRLMGHHSPQLNAKAGTGGNNLPLILQFLNRNDILRRKIAAVCGAYERSGDWPEDEWVDITPDVSLNIFIDMDGRRRATAFEASDADLEFGVDIEYVGDCP